MGTRGRPSLTSATKPVDPAQRQQQGRAHQQGSQPPARAAPQSKLQPGRKRKHAEYAGAGGALHSLAIRAAAPQLSWPGGAEPQPGAAQAGQRLVQQAAPYKQMPAAGEQLQ